MCDVAADFSSSRSRLLRRPDLGEVFCFRSGSRKFASSSSSPISSNSLRDLGLVPPRKITVGWLCATFSMNWSCSVTPPFSTAWDWESMEHPSLGRSVATMLLMMSRTSDRTALRLRQSAQLVGLFFPIGLVANLCGCIVALGVDGFVQATGRVLGPFLLIIILPLIVNELNFTPSPLCGTRVPVMHNRSPQFFQSARVLSQMSNIARISSSAMLLAFKKCPLDIT